MQLRCLIIGGDGEIGRALRQSLMRAGHSVMSTTRRRESASTGNLYLDLEAPHCNFPDLDVAIFCAGISGFVESRISPALTNQVNVTAPLHLARSLTRAGARLILLSTSAVFDCRKPYVDENATPAPRSAYGRSKAEAEAGLLGLGPQVSVLRLTKVMKPNTGILSEWIRSLGEGKTIRAFDDHRFCPLRIEDVVHAIGALTENGEGGVYHVSGAADLSFADAAEFLAGRIGAAKAQVEAVHGSGAGIDEDDLTPFTSLATGRLSELTGFVPPKPFDVLQDVYGDEIGVARKLMNANAR